MKSLARVQSNPRRGLRYRKAAQEFFDLVQPPCILSDAEMDVALEQIDPEYEGKGNGKHGRATWSQRLRAAAAHSAMNTGHYFAYTLRQVGRGKWDVKAVQDAITVGVALEMLRQAIDCARRNERYLVEGVPVDRISDLDVRLAEQSSRWTFSTLENCQLMAETAIKAHSGMMRSILEARKLPALPTPNEEAD